MANKYYELINEPQVVVDGKEYEVKDYNMNLSEFLKTHYKEKLLIFEPTIMTNNIKGIVI